MTVEVLAPILRSSKAEVRNPLTTLPAAKKIAALPFDVRALLRELLLELRDDCRKRADKAWRTRKPPVAAYWAAMGVYAGHLARLVARKD